MSPLLLHSSTNQYNINGLLCTYIEMFRIQTCCNYILSAAEGFQGQEATCADPGIFDLVLSLFYSLKRGSNGCIAAKTLLILYKGSRGGPLFSRGGGVQLFPGGSPNANFYRNSYTYLLFSRGSVRTPYLLLDPHTGNVINGTIFITVRPLTIIVRHWFVRINDRWGFQMIHWYCARLTPSRNTALGSGSSCNSAFFSPK